MASHLNRRTATTDGVGHTMVKAGELSQRGVLVAEDGGIVQHDRRVEVIDTEVAAATMRLE